MIDETAGFPAIAYVGDTPWHGLGQKLTPDADIITWTKSAGLDWNAERTPVEYTLPGDDIPQFMDSRHVLYRSDTKAALSIVSDSYKLVQPAQIMDFFRELTEQSDATMETAGSLHSGRVIWALARVGENLAIKDDLVAPYILLSTSYDQTSPTIAKLVATRVVCNNTIQVAMREGGDRQVRIPHSTDFRTTDIRAGLDISLSEFEAFRQKALKLADKPFTQSDMDKYLITLLQPTEGEVDGDVIRKSKAYGKIIDLFNGGQLGAEQDASKGTAWGALNSVTQFIDHVKGNNQSNRLSEAWFGGGMNLKTRALELLAA